MLMKMNIYQIFKKIFKEHIEEDYERKNRVNIQKDARNKFKIFINSFENNYIENNNKDKNFRKKLIKKYANYLFMDNINVCLSSNYTNSSIKLSDLIELVTITNNTTSLTSNTVYITHPWKGQNLTGNTNAYRGVVYNGFVHDEHNVKGIYIEDIDTAFIFNGNHSVSIGSLIDDMNLTTNKNLKSTNLKESFFNAKITYSKIYIENKTIEINNWKLAALLKMIQTTYI